MTDKYLAKIRRHLNKIFKEYGLVYNRSLGAWVNPVDKSRKRTWETEYGYVMPLGDTLSISDLTSQNKLYFKFIYFTKNPLTDEEYLFQELQRPYTTWVSQRELLKLARKISQKDA
jgi:hypothetical protein